MGIFNKNKDEEQYWGDRVDKSSRDIIKEVEIRDQNKDEKTFKVPSFITDKFTYHRYGIVSIDGLDYSSENLEQYIRARVPIPDSIPEKQTTIDVSLFAAANSLVTSMINDMIDNPDEYTGNYDDDDNTIYKIEKAQIDEKEAYMAYVAFYDEDGYTYESNFIVFEIE